MSDVADRVKKIVVEHLGVEADKVIDNANFIDDLGADSLDTVELVMAFEEEFNVEIPDDAAETIVTVGDAIKFPREERGVITLRAPDRSRSAPDFRLESFAAASIASRRGDFRFYYARACRLAKGPSTFRRHARYCLN